jgi:hypothetical protein
MKFKRLPSGDYQATRKDGQVISLRRLDEPYNGYQWGVYYADDFHGDNTAHAKTKRELVACENHYEANM